MNPYARLMETFDPNEFCVPSWLHDLLTKISGREPSSIDLIGLPGMGKTSLLEYIAHPQGAFATGPGNMRAHVFPVLIRCGELHSARDFFQAIYDGIQRELPGFQQSAGTQWTGLISVGNAASSDAPEVADQVELIFRKLHTRGVRPVLLLDDFDVPFAVLSAAETVRMRPWRDLISFVLTTQRELYLVNPDAAGSTFYNTMPARWMHGILERDSALHLIRKPAANYGRTFPDLDVQALWDMTDGHPHATILAARVLWDTREAQTILDKPEVPLPPTELQVLQQMLQQMLITMFEQYWSAVSDTERAVLTEIAHRGAVAASQRGAINHLKEMGLIRSEIDRESILPHLFAEYVRKSC